MKKSSSENARSENETGDKNHINLGEIKNSLTNLPKLNLNNSSSNIDTVNKSPPNHPEEIEIILNPRLKPNDPNVPNDNNQNIDNIKVHHKRKQFRFNSVKVQREKIMPIISRHNSLNQPNKKVKRNKTVKIKYLQRRGSLETIPSFTKNNSSLIVEGVVEGGFYTQEHVYGNSNNNSANFRNKAKTEYCDICFQDIKDKFTLACGDFFCHECITTHVVGSLTNITMFKNLRCPKNICNEKIKDIVIEKLLSEKELEKYTKTKVKIEALCNPLNFACPIPDCESFGDKTNIKNSILTCLNNHSFCIKCLKTAHVGEPCIITKDESEVVISNNKLIKQCPNCKSWVEKQPAGCNNLTCANVWCNFSFCWICMRASDKNHYSNPLSTCFGMQETLNDSHFAKHKCLRITKCMLIFLLMIAILPIIILLFSFIVFGFYILAFVLDGSAVKNMKLKTERRQKVFRFLIYAIYISISLPSMNLGYWSLTFLTVSSPFIYLIKKCKRSDNSDD